MRVKLEATISTCQKAFMRGRRITDHLRSVLESFYDDVENGVNSPYLLIDFAKAFDRVNRPALWRIMQSQGWDDGLIALLKALNSDTQVHLRWQGARVRTTHTQRGETRLPSLPTLVHSSS